MSACNDWPIKKFLVLSGSLLLALFGLVGLASLGFDIPILRQIVGFLFLTFIPGILILRILRVHNVHIVESLLYSVGLSLAFIMAMGVVANFALPPLGILRPIALLPLLITTTFAILLLCLFAYIRDKDFRPSSQSGNRASQSTWQSFRDNPAPYLLAVLLPLLAIMGTSMINVYDSNIVIFVLLLTIAIIIGLVAFNKFIPPRVYPLMVFMMALALMYQTTLISDYLVGNDIHQERYWAWLVLENGFWNATAPFPMNSCLSIVVLAPVHSLFLNMDIIWLFKIIYPFLFALMPLALFRIFSLQIKPQYAFLSVVFFITLPMFTMDMVQLARQQVSELFFALVILLLVDRRLTMLQRTTLVIIFGCGVVVSYYGLGTGYTIGFLTIGALVLFFIKSKAGRAIWQWLIGKSNSLPADLTDRGAFSKRALTLIVCAGLIFMFGYYGAVASGTGLRGTRIFVNIVKNISEPVTQYFGPEDENTTDENHVPPAPSLGALAQESGLSVLTPRLEWHTSPGATSYRLQVSTDTDFIETVIDETGIEETYYYITKELKPNAIYFWRVNASNTYGTSEWSLRWCFNTWGTTVSHLVEADLPPPELPAFVQAIIVNLPMLNPLVKEPLVQTALGLDFAAASAGGKIWRIFQYLVQLCLVIGFIRLVFRPAKLGGLKAEYLSLIIVSMLILIGIFILPTISYGLGATRIWQITLLLMAPLFIFGSEAIANGVAKLIRAFRKGFESFRSGYNCSAPLTFTVLLIMIPYFIFNSGVIFELNRSHDIYFIDVPYSISLSSHRLDINTVYARQDVTAATWLSRVEGEGYPIYNDPHSSLAFLDYWGDEKGFRGIERSFRMPPFVASVRDMALPCYIYFRVWNIENEMLTFPTGYGARRSIGFGEISGLPQLVEDGSRIYNNGGAQVLIVNDLAKMR